MAASTLAFRRAYVDDELVVTAGAMAGQCSRNGPATLARALEITPARASQLYSGDRSGVFFRSLQAASQLALDDDTTPWPWITQLGIEAMEAELQYHDTEWLLNRRVILEALEARQQRALELAKDSRNRRAEIEAHRNLAATHREIVAVEELLLRIPGQPDMRTQ